MDIETTDRARRECNRIREWIGDARRHVCNLLVNLPGERVPHVDEETSYALRSLEAAEGELDSLQDGIAKAGAK